MLPDNLPADRDKLLTWWTECWQCGKKTAVVWPRDDGETTQHGNRRFVRLWG